MEKKRSEKVLLAIMGVMIIAALVLGIFTIQYPFLDIIALIPMLFAAVYVFWLYNKPHGNMLKYAMLIFAVERIIESIGCIKQGWDVSYNQTAKILASVIIIYVAGRLNRMDQNKILLPIAFALLSVGVIVAVITFASQYPPIYVVSWFGEPVLVLILIVAYFVRYKEHKEAGLKDADWE